MTCTNCIHIPSTGMGAKIDPDPAKSHSRPNHLIAGRWKVLLELSWEEKVLEI